MGRRKHLFVALVLGFIAIGFILCGMCIPAQLVLELKPFAQVVLRSGNLDNWTAESLNLDPNKFERVKSNYQSYLKGNGGGESESSDEDSNSSESESSENDEIGSPLSSSRLKRKRFLQSGMGHTNETETDENIRKMATAEYTGISNLDSVMDSDDYSESSDSMELTLEEQLQSVPIDETVSVGLFESKVCIVSQSNEKRCNKMSVKTGMQEVLTATDITENEMTTQFWSHMRMECIFSLAACIGGVVCLAAAFKPCCDIEQTPFYLGSVCFLASGALALVTVIRTILLSMDILDTLEEKINVTTDLRMPWSILFFGIGGTFALTAMTSVLLSRQCGLTKYIYKLLSTKNVSSTQDGYGVNMHMIRRGERDERKKYVDDDVKQDFEKPLYPNA